MTEADRKLLIEHSVKIDALCSLIKTHIETIDRKDVATSKTHKEIFTKIDRKVDGVTFRWLTGVLIIIVLSLFGVAIRS